MVFNKTRHWQWILDTSRLEGLLVTFLAGVILTCLTTVFSDAAAVVTKDDVNLSNINYDKQLSNDQSLSISKAYATSPTESALIHSKNIRVENNFTPTHVSKSTQNFFKNPENNKATNSTTSALKQLKVSSSIKATPDRYQTLENFAQPQSPAELQQNQSAIKLTNSAGTDVDVTSLKPYSDDETTEHSALHNANGVLSNANPSAFMDELHRETWRALKDNEQKLKTSNNTTVSSASNYLANQHANNTDHVQVKEVQHRNDFASTYRRRMMSEEEYANYFNWINDQEIENLHAKIMAERNSADVFTRDKEAAERTANWSNLATASIAKHQTISSNDKPKLSISSDPRQEQNISIILGITSEKSANTSVNSVHPDQSQLYEVLGMSNLGLEQSSLQTNNKQNEQGLSAPQENTLNTTKAIQSLSSKELDINLGYINRDTGELSKKDLFNDNNPFLTDNIIENTLSLQPRNKSLSKYLDQVMTGEEGTTAKATPIAPPEVKDTPSDVFVKDTPEVVNDSAKQSNLTLFKLSSRLDRNNVIFTIEISSGSYIYQNSLSVIGSGGLSFNQPLLPKATKHEDMQGTSLVYFKRMELIIPVFLCDMGDVLTLNYQGCDAAGICYPPQRFSVSMPNSIKQKSENSDLVSMLNNSVHLLNTSQEDSIAKLLVDNIFIGLLLCFILGIGLDLTPCVLPMLPIFSTMLVGSRSNTINVKDDIEAEADKVTAELQKEDAEKKASAKKQALENKQNSVEQNTSSEQQVAPQQETQTKDVSLYQSKDDTEGVSNTNISQDNKSHQHTKKQKQAFARFKKHEFKVVLLQNTGYAIGLSFSYMILGLLFASLGASLHNILQSPVVLICIALLLCACALSCAGVLDISMPSFITNKLQARISKLQTSRFSGALLFGMLSALIASPCTSAPLAGALIYVFTTGNMLTGAMYFWAIGLGMAFPLFIIGVFGSKILSKSGILGDLVKRILVVVLLITAYFMVSHLLGTFDLIMRTMVIYIVCVYLITSAVCLILKHKPSMKHVLTIAFLCLLPSYVAYNYFGSVSNSSRYEFFSPVKSMYELNKMSQDKYTFVVFTADWCTNCKQMESNVYSSDYFMLASNELNKLVVDITDSKSQQVKEIIKHFNLVGVPCYVILDPAGNVIEQRLGVQSRETVIKSIHGLHYQRQYGL